MSRTAGGVAGAPWSQRTAGSIGVWSGPSFQPQGSQRRHWRIADARSSRAACWMARRRLMPTPRLLSPRRGIACSRQARSADGRGAGSGAGRRVREPTTAAPAGAWGRGGAPAWPARLDCRRHGALGTSTRRVPTGWLREPSCTRGSWAAQCRWASFGAWRIQGAALDRSRAPQSRRRQPFRRPCRRCVGRPPRRWPVQRRLVRWVVCSLEDLQGWGVRRPGRGRYPRRAVRRLVRPRAHARLPPLQESYF